MINKLIQNYKDNLKVFIFLFYKGNLIKNALKKF